MGEKYQSEGHICIMFLLGFLVFVSFEGFVGEPPVLLNSWASVFVVMYISVVAYDLGLRTITYFYG